MDTRSATAMRHDALKATALSLYQLGGGVAAPTSTATPASAAPEAEGECEEDSRWLDNDDKCGTSSDGSGDGSIVALSAGAGHSDAHLTVHNGICVVRDDGG